MKAQLAFRRRSVDSPQFAYASYELHAWYSEQSLTLVSLLINRDYTMGPWAPIRNLED